MGLSYMNRNHSHYVPNAVIPINDDIDEVIEVNENFREHLESGSSYSQGGSFGIKNEFDNFRDENMDDNFNQNFSKEFEHFGKLGDDFETDHDVSNKSNSSSSLTRKSDYGSMPPHPQALLVTEDNFDSLTFSTPKKVQKKFHLTTGDRTFDRYNNLIPPYQRNARGGKSKGRTTNDTLVLIQKYEGLVRDKNEENKRNMGGIQIKQEIGGDMGPNSDLYYDGGYYEEENYDMDNFGKKLKKGTKKGKKEKNLDQSFDEVFGEQTLISPHVYFSQFNTTNYGNNDHTDGKYDNTLNISSISPIHLTGRQSRNGFNHNEYHDLFFESNIPQGDKNHPQSQFFDPNFESDFFTDRNLALQDFPPLSENTTINSSLPQFSGDTTFNSEGSKTYPHSILKSSTPSTSFSSDGTNSVKKRKRVSYDDGYMIIHPHSDRIGGQDHDDIGSISLQFNQYGDGGSYSDRMDGYEDGHTFDDVGDVFLYHKKRQKVDDNDVVAKNNKNDQNFDQQAHFERISTSQQTALNTSINSNDGKYYQYWKDNNQEDESGGDSTPDFDQEGKKFEHDHDQNKFYQNNTFHGTPFSTQNADSNRQDYSSTRDLHVSNPTKPTSDLNNTYNDSSYRPRNEQDDEKNAQPKPHQAQFYCSCCSKRYYSSPPALENFMLCKRCSNANITLISPTSGPSGPQLDTSNAQASSHLNTTTTTLSNGTILISPASGQGDRTFNSTQTAPQQPPPITIGPLIHQYLGSPPPPPQPAPPPPPPPPPQPSTTQQIQPDTQSYLNQTGNTANMTTSIPQNMKSGQNYQNLPPSHLSPPQRSTYPPNNMSYTTPVTLDRFRRSSMGPEIKVPRYNDIGFRPKYDPNNLLAQQSGYRHQGQYRGSNWRDNRGDSFGQQFGGGYTNPTYQGQYDQGGVGYQRDFYRPRGDINTTSNSFTNQ
jgi:hypothetical protein